VVLGGVLQILLAAGEVARLMRVLPRSVMVGFVDALAILIFLAQLPYLTGVGWPVYTLLAVGLVIMVGLPRLTKAVPAPLVAIVALTAFTVIAGVTVPTVGDEGALPDSLPVLGIPSVPLNLETLRIVGPFAVAVALVGLMESLMTAKLVDSITCSTSWNGGRTCGGCTCGQGWSDSSPSTPRSRSTGATSPRSRPRRKRARSAPTSRRWS
jgi:SulP family sulfate permease